MKSFLWFDTSEPHKVCNVRRHVTGGRGRYQPCPRIAVVATFSTADLRLHNFERETENASFTVHQHNVLPGDASGNLKIAKENVRRQKTTNQTSK